MIKSKSVELLSLIEKVIHPELIPRKVFIGALNRALDKWNGKGIARLLIKLNKWAAALTVYGEDHPKFVFLSQINKPSAWYQADEHTVYINLDRIKTDISELGRDEYLNRMYDDFLTHEYVHVTQAKYMKQSKDLTPSKRRLADLKKTGDYTKFNFDLEPMAYAREAAGQILRKSEYKNSKDKSVTARRILPELAMTTKIIETYGRHSRPYQRYLRDVMRYLDELG